jgi:hypothetical protein
MVFIYKPACVQHLHVGRHLATSDMLAHSHHVDCASMVLGREVNADLWTRVAVREERMKRKNSLTKYT